MSSTAKTAQGTTIAYAPVGTGTPTYVPVKNVSSISGFDGKATEIDTTDLNSTAKERVLGLQDWGTLTLTTNINLKEVSHMALLTAKKAGTALMFQVTLSDATTIAFEAFVAAFPIEAKVDAVYTGSISLTITGDITVTVTGS